MNYPNRTIFSGLGALLVMLFLSVNSVFAYDPPSPQLPANNATCIPADVQLNWSVTDMNDIRNFRIQISESATFATMHRDEQGITVSNFTPADLKPNTFYFWRVIGTYTDYSTLQSSQFSFKTRNSAPVLGTPLHNSKCVSITVELNWAQVAGADNYKLHVSSKADFSDEVFLKDDLQGTFTAIPDLENSHAYYWRIASITDGCLSEWSSPKMFMTNPKAPTPTKPANKTHSLNKTFTIEWESDVDFDNTTVEYSLVEDFSIKEEITLDAKAFTIVSKEFNTKYYWRLRGDSSSCLSDWTKAWTARTKYDTVKLELPVNDSKCVSMNPKLQWTPMADVLSYRLQVSKTGTFVGDDLVFDFDKITDNFYDIETPRSMNHYFWRVKAEDNSNSGEWSKPFHFVSSLHAPSVITPAKGQTGLLLNQKITWLDIFEDETIYTVQISTEPKFIQLIMDTTNFKTPEMDFVFPKYMTQYYIRLKANFEDCESAWTETIAVKTTLPAPTLTLPIDSAKKVSNIPTYTWEEVDNASYYEIIVSDSVDFSHVVVSGKNIPKTTSILNRLAPETKYFWKVRAKFNEGFSNWSVPFSFTTTLLGPVLPELLTPENNSSKLAVEVDLVCKETARAKTYDWQIAYDSDFNSMLVEKNDVDKNTIKLEKLKNYTEYFWRVRASNDSGKTAWSETWKFKTIKTLPTDAAVLVSPADNADEQYVDIKLKWNKVEFADYYHIQVSKDETFATLVKDIKANWKNEYKADKLEKLTTYYWRVAGWNEAGKAAWSPTWSFKTKNSSSVNEGTVRQASAFPNPVSNQVTLGFIMKSPQKVSISIYAIDGTRVYSHGEKTYYNGYNPVSINVEGFANGTYIYVIESRDSKISGKITVSK